MPEARELIPAGTYTAKLKDGRKGVSSKNTPRWTAKFRIAGGPQDGRIVWADFYLTDAARPVSRDRLRRMGIDIDENLDRPRFGQLYDIKIVHRQGPGGEVYAEVSDAVPHASSTPAQSMDDLDWNDDDFVPGMYDPVGEEEEYPYIGPLDCQGPDQYDDDGHGLDF